MTILVRKATIKDIHSPHHNKLCDILIKNGVIAEISSDISTKADKIIEFDAQCVSPGWLDPFASGTDPGYEHKDTLEHISRSAAKGGYTHVFLTPNTKPVVETKSNIEYINRFRSALPVALHPIGAVTKNTDGKELTEMYEMNQSGSPAFSDGHKTIQSAGLLIKALQYVKTFNGVIIQIPDDRSISANGQMNEGVTSTQIGLKGKHKIAESIMVSRDLVLAEYAQSRLHLTGITTSASIVSILGSKEKNVDVSCSVTPQHLFFNEQDLLDYDTNLKMNPPLRSEADRVALLEAVKNGSVDCIATHHAPHENDMKLCEFEYAADGMLCLESAFGMLGALDIPIDLILKMVCYNPRKIFKMNASIAVGEKADLTIFNSNYEYEFSREHIRSSSTNTPMLGKKLKGIALATILHDQLNIN